MATFRLVLALHAPVILPVVPPRLDTLLLEGTRRLTQDWQARHPLPLVIDDALGRYRASQIIFASTPHRPLTAVQVGLSTKTLKSDLTLVKKLPKRLRQDGGPDAQRLTSHQAISAPYAYFYADGDAEECLKCLSVIRALGREHKRHYGAFSIEGVEAMDSTRWALRSWPEHEKARAAELVEETWIADQQRLGDGEPACSVVRPPRVIREVRHA